MNWRGTKLIDRIRWAAENLEEVEPEYCAVYEDPETKMAFIMTPSQQCMAMLIYGGLMPPPWVKQMLKEEEQKEGFTSHSDHGKGHLLHTTPPIPALTQEQAIEYLVQTDVPKEAWDSLIICRRDQIKKDREFRNAWRVKLSAKNSTAIEHQESQAIEQWIDVKERVYA